jgi:putative nucleotidyltransferase with HDIG domain
VAVAIENAKLYKDLRELFLGTVASLAEVIDAKSPYTHGHSIRVSNYAKEIANEMGLIKEEQETIELAGLLHDVGKIGVSEEIINKPGRLTDEEYGEMKKHPSIGADIIEKVKALKSIIPGVRHHQERYDGRGYPDGIKGNEIPLIARILAVADTFDAMTSDRPYRKRFEDEFALSEINKCAGTQFDPIIADAFLKAYEKNKKRFLSLKR